MNEQQKIELEAAAFRRLVALLKTRTDVQNIELMNLAGFCRNCFSKWYVEEATEKGINLSLDEAREMVYGIPYEAWKDKYQLPATSEQLAKFEQLNEKS